MRAASSDTGPTAIDPVCGMSLTVKPDTRSERFGETDFHFCSQKCQTKFKADLWFYSSGRARQRKKPAPAKVQYTCPMHPEIVRDAPGACPICGMALEPMLPSDEPSEELTDFTRRMWISAAAAVPLIVLTMGELVGLPVRDWLGHQNASYLEFLLATPIVLWAALPFFRRGWDSVVNRSPNMWTLISLGVAAAYLYSIVATFLPGLFPEVYRMGHGVGTYFEAAVVIIALFFCGPGAGTAGTRTHRRCGALRRFSSTSVDPVRALQLSHIGDDRTKFGIRQALFDRWHVAELPVMGQHAVSSRQHEGHVAVMRGLINAVDKGRRDTLLPGSIRTMAGGADSVVKGLALLGLRRKRGRDDNLGHGRAHRCRTRASRRDHCGLLGAMTRDPIPARRCDDGHRDCANDIHVHVEFSKLFLPRMRYGCAPFAGIFVGIGRRRVETGCHL